MFDIRSCYVEATEGTLEGRVFRVVPGCEGEAIELFRRAVDRFAEKAGRGEDPPETLGIFANAETTRKLIPDGIHEAFLAVVMLELMSRKNAKRSVGE